MALPFNLIFGGITGLIGSITTSITNYKIQKLKNDQKDLMVVIYVQNVQEKK